MMLAAIFQNFEHLKDFQTISYGGNFVFQNEARIFHRQKICRPGLPRLFLHSEALGAMIRET